MSTSYQLDLKKPRPIKGIVQIGVGKLITSHPDQEKKILEDASYVLSMITGQKPKIVIARKAIAGFKLKKGTPIALLVTLRKKRLFDFIQRLVTYALPRAKDFYGLKETNFDNQGNINLGFKDINIFPEAMSDKIKYTFGLGINLVGNGKNRDENLKMWKKYGFPIKVAK